MEALVKWRHFSFSQVILLVKNGNHDSVSNNFNFLTLFSPCFVDVRQLILAPYKGISIAFLSKSTSLKSFVRLERQQLNWYQEGWAHISLEKVAWNGGNSPLIIWWLWLVINEWRYPAGHYRPTASCTYHIFPIWQESKKCFSREEEKAYYDWDGSRVECVYH